MDRMARARQTPPVGRKHQDNGLSGRSRLPPPQGQDETDRKQRPDETETTQTTKATADIDTCIGRKHSCSMQTHAAQTWTHWTIRHTIGQLGITTQSGTPPMHQEAISSQFAVPSAQCTIPNTKFCNYGPRSDPGHKVGPQRGRHVRGRTPPLPAPRSTRQLSPLGQEIP